MEWNLRRYPVEIPLWRSFLNGLAILYQGEDVQTTPCTQRLNYLEKRHEDGSFLPLGWQLHWTKQPQDLCLVPFQYLGSLDVWILVILQLGIHQEWLHSSRRKLEFHHLHFYHGWNKYVTLWNVIHACCDGSVQCHDHWSSNALLGKSILPQKKVAKEHWIWQRHRWAKRLLQELHRYFWN